MIKIVLTQEKETGMKIGNLRTMESVQSWNCDQNVGGQWKNCSQGSLQKGCHT